jgi:cytochrome o ubiquinol oxidase operon protein cyoD
MTKDLRKGLSNDDAIGIVFAVILTATSFWAAGTSLLWAPGVPSGLAVLALAQIGAHLFFLNITTGTDGLSDGWLVAFGGVILVLVIVGSLWILSNIGADPVPASAFSPPRAVF